MWYSLGKGILKYRFALLIALFAATGVMAYFAARVQLSYEFTRAIPTDNEKYQQYQAFRQTFGEDGNLVVVGIETPHLFTTKAFAALAQLHQKLKAVKGVENVLSIPESINLVKNDSSGKLDAVRIFSAGPSNQVALDSSRAIFENLPFYQGLLYNPQTGAYLTGINVNRDIMNSKARSELVADIMQEVKVFEQQSGLKAHVSGLPFIRTSVGDLVKKEMRLFLIGSLVLSAITLLVFFRSLSAMGMSLLVVIMGVVWSLGTMVLLGYKITLLTALIPPLLVVIGVPNCIYFLNKYHSAYRDTGEKHAALVTMVGRMGIVTLFCNIAAAIGFAVFALTKSALLKEFGAVAGINIMVLFVISLMFIPPVLSYLPPPRPHELRYLDNRFLIRLLERIERWTIHHKKWVYGITVVFTLVAIGGIFRLKSEGYIVDDLPKTDKIYTDLKWFEHHFKGVMPLEIVVNTKKPNGAIRLETLLNIEELSAVIAGNNSAARPLSLVEGIKFGNQAYWDGDSMSYALPGSIPSALRTALRQSGGSDTANALSKLAGSFVDDSLKQTRISVNMKDVGSVRLPVILDSFRQQANQIFDTTEYDIQFTGSSVTFLEGSTFIINGLKESVMWAFLLIALCMLYLFKSFRILICSLIPNVVPLLVTAGLMGWAGIALKPSTVLVFSVALGIAIDVTIRFLINYKQELPAFGQQVQPTLISTIRHTGISIIYTSLVLIAGFIIFCFSGFGGTKALGWLTSLTLVVGTITNLVLLPVLLLSLRKKSIDSPRAEK